MLSIWPHLVFLATLLHGNVSAFEGTIEFNNKDAAQRRATYDEDVALQHLMEEMDKSFNECGFPVSYENPDMPINPTAAMQLAKLSRPCLAEQEVVMRQAFLNFEKCSGYEQLEMEEDLFIAFMGAMIKCVNSMSALDVASMNIPEQCAIAVLGNHPLGQMIRDEILRPESTEKCFEALANEVPICTIDLWPYPVDGKAVRMGACITSKFEEIFKDQCVEGLETFNTCLPKPDELSAMDCRKYSTACTDGFDDSLFVMVLMGLPATIRGIPLPVTCQIDAGKRGFSDQIERYEAYREKCAASGKGLWERLENPENDPTNPKLKSIKDFIRATESTVDQPTRSEIAPVQVSQKGGGKGGGSFGFGMISGILLMLAAYGVLLYIARDRNMAERLGLPPGYVELSTWQ